MEHSYVDLRLDFNSFSFPDNNKAAGYYTTQADILHDRRYTVRWSEQIKVNNEGSEPDVFYAMRVFWLYSKLPGNSGIRMELAEDHLTAFAVVEGVSKPDLRIRYLRDPILSSDKKCSLATVFEVSVPYPEKDTSYPMYSYFVEGEITGEATLLEIMEICELITMQKKKEQLDEDKKHEAKLKGHNADYAFDSKVYNTAKKSREDAKDALIEALYPQLEEASSSNKSLRERLRAFLLDRANSTKGIPRDFYSVIFDDHEMLKELIPAIAHNSKVVDPIQIELVRGWLSEGYCWMSGQEMKNHLEAKGLATNQSTAAVQKLAISKPYELKTAKDLRPYDRPMR
ncbi:MAG: hypothetical protein ACSHX8_07030 [Opitutaceae bacterium]